MSDDSQSTHKENPPREGAEARAAALPGPPPLKSMTVAKLRKIFPHAPKLAKEINRRYAAVAGHAIPGKHLYRVLVNLGDLDPQVFLDYLDRRGYEVLGHSGSYGHFPERANRCAALAGATREAEALRAMTAGGAR